ncbi:PqqD family protein [candidate division KSB1 bacterium]|nr:PqqD family protein [candidate division KSB1 bacterium]
MEQNFLELIPIRLVNFEKQVDGRITLFQSKFRHPFLVKYLQPRLKQPFIKVHLDEIGSELWDLCDGQNTIEQIATGLSEKFGSKVEPVYERMAQYFQSLFQLKFIYYQNYDPTLKK